MYRHRCVRFAVSFPFLLCYSDTSIVYQSVVGLLVRPSVLADAGSFHQRAVLEPSCRDASLVEADDPRTIWKFPALCRNHCWTVYKEGLLKVVHQNIIETKSTRRDVEIRL